MKSQTDSLEHSSLRQHCKAVRAPVIGGNFLSLAEQTVKEKHSHIRYLEALLAMESEERDLCVAKLTSALEIREFLGHTPQFVNRFTDPSSR